MVIDYGLLDGHRFADVAPHPFWLIVLLISMSYGTAEGLVAAALSSSALLLGNLPPQAFDQDGYSYLFAIARQPLLWFVAAGLFGAVRDRQLAERGALQGELGAARTRTNLLFDNYGKLKEAKGRLETEIATQRQTVDYIYQAARSIDRLSCAEVVQGAVELIQAVLSAEKFSLYLVQADRLQAAMTHGWLADEPRASEFGRHSPLFECIVGQGRSLLAVEAEDRAILGEEGLAAAPLIGPDSGEVFGMLKIDAMAFFDFNPITLGHFKRLADWLAAAYEKARRFERLSLAATGSDHGDRAGYPEIAGYLAKLGERAGLEVSAAVISIEGLPETSQGENERRRGDIRRAIEAELRGTDLVYTQTGEATLFSVILPLTAIAEAERVIARAVTSLDARWGNREDGYVSIAATVQALHPSKGNRDVAQSTAIVR